MRRGRLGDTRQISPRQNSPRKIDGHVDVLQSASETGVEVGFGRGSRLDGFVIHDKQRLRNTIADGVMRCVARRQARHLFRREQSVSG